MFTFMFAQTQMVLPTIFVWVLVLAAVVIGLAGTLVSMIAFLALRRFTTIGDCVESIEYALKECRDSTLLGAHPIGLELETAIISFLKEGTDVADWWRQELLEKQLERRGLPIWRGRGAVMTYDVAEAEKAINILIAKLNEVQPKWPGAQAMLEPCLQDHLPTRYAGVIKELGFDEIRPLMETVAESVLTRKLLERPNPPQGWRLLRVLIMALARAKNFQGQHYAFDAYFKEDLIGLTWLALDLPSGKPKGEAAPETHRRSDDSEGQISQTAATHIESANVVIAGLIEELERLRSSWPSLQNKLASDNRQYGQEQPWKFNIVMRNRTEGKCDALLEALTIVGQNADLRMFLVKRVGNGNPAELLLLLFVTAFADAVTFRKRLLAMTAFFANDLPTLQRLVRLQEVEKPPAEDLSTDAGSPEVGSPSSGTDTTSPEGELASSAVSTVATAAEDRPPNDVVSDGLCS